MSNNLPRKVAEQIKSLIYAEADSAQYCAMSRTDSGAFMDRLVSQENIGGVIAQYILKSDVKTYIKDAVLNRYSKDYARRSKPNDMTTIIRSRFSIDSVIWEERSGVEVYVGAEEGVRRYVVVAYGTFLKWETALRKLLLRAVALEELQVDLLAVLMAQGKALAPSDKMIVAKALKRCGAEILVVGE